MQPQKWQNDLSLFPRQTIQHHSKSSLCPNHLCWRSWSWSVLWRPPRTNAKKYILFIIGDWNVKAGNQEISGVTGKFGFGVQNETGQRLTEVCQENTLVMANALFQQHKRQLHKWTSSNWLYSLKPKIEKLYTVGKNKTGSWLWLRAWAPYCKIQT